MHQEENYMPARFCKFFRPTVHIEPGHSRADHLKDSCGSRVFRYLRAKAARDPRQEWFTWPSLPTIARVCNCDVRSVRLWLRWFEAQGWIVPHSAWRNG